MAKYSVSYIYQIIDKYTPSLNRIAHATNRARESFKRAHEKTLEFSRSLKDFGKRLTLFASTPILLMGSALIKAASDAEEVRSKFATIFRDLGNGAEISADKFAASFGLAGTKARELLGNTADMLTGFGFAQKEALELSLRVNELAADLASFTNFSGGAAGASAALTKALLGERESIKSLGIAILEEDVKRKVAVLRSEGMRFNTEREAKAYATLQLAIKQSGNAIGDYNRTKHSFANTVRRVRGRIQDLSESFGRIMLPAATKALNIIEKLLISFNGLSNTTKTVILSILGIIAVIGPLLLILGSIALIIPVLKLGLVSLGVVIGVLTSPIAIAIGALFLLVKAFKFAYNYNQSFRDAVDKTVDSVKKAFTGMTETLRPVFEWLEGWFMRITKFMRTISVGLLETLGFDFTQMTVSNVAAQAAANQNTLNGTIAVTANNATVEHADLQSSAPGNLGVTLAGAR